MRCDKCTGLVVSGYEDDDLVPHCLNCSKRFWPPNVTPIDNANLRWESVVCDRCHDRKAVRGKEHCRECRKGAVTPPSELVA